MSPARYRESLDAPIPGPSNVIASIERGRFLVRRFPLVEAEALAAVRLRASRREKNVRATS